MGYPNTGSEGTVVSWGSANYYSNLLAAVSGFAINLNVNGDDIDITEYNTYQYSCLSGLSQWSATLEAYGFATPRLGNVGTLTWSAGGYALHVYEWEWTIETENVHDITELASSPASGPVWRSWRPDSTKVSGRFRARADSATALVVPHQPGTALPTLTLVYGDSATDEQISGAARIQQVSPSIRRGSLTEVEFAFTGSGAWTPAGTGSIFGSTAFTQPLWSEGGSAAGAIVIDTKSSATRKTLTGADSFWTRQTLRCAVGEAVSLTVDIQGSGALTPS